MRKGKWMPCGYRFSSNWKELSTLLLTLQHLRGTAPDSVIGTTVFYFTDNSTTYWISSSGSSSSPELHHLIEAIRTLEFQLQCQLQVVHVPGYILIQQGTDGLSRGVWMSRYHSLLNKAAPLSGLFAPFPFNPSLVDDFLAQIPHQGLSLRVGLGRLLVGVRLGMPVTNLFGGASLATFMNLALCIPM